MSEFFNEDSDISYLSADEKEVLEYFRTMPKDSAAAILQLIRTLNKDKAK